jgi:hypothetical protein
MAQIKILGRRFGDFKDKLSLFGLIGGIALGEGQPIKRIERGGLRAVVKETIKVNGFLGLGLGRTRQSGEQRKE